MGRNRAILRRGRAPSAALLACLLAGLALAGPAEARRRAAPPPEDLGPGPSVGRNAGPAIGAGLAGLGAGWLDTMANFYADPRVTNRAYFDYYQRPYGPVRGRYR